MARSNKISFASASAYRSYLLSQMSTKPPIRSKLPPVYLGQYWSSDVRLSGTVGWQTAKLVEAKFTDWPVDQFDWQAGIAGKLV